MPYWCLGKIVRALNQHEKALKGSKVLVLGVAYKSDIDDTRESPALKLIELLQGEGADVSYHDPFVPELREQGLTSAPLDAAAADCVVIVTAHSGIDYDELVEQAPLVVDLRNATGANGRRTGRSGSSERRCASARPGSATGARTSPGTSASSPTCAGSATSRRTCSRKPRPATRRRGRRRDFEELLADPELDAVVDRDPGRHAFRAGQAGAQRRQARLRREAAGPDERPRRRSSSRSPRSAGSS